VKKVNPIRSSQQNKYLHVLLAYFASEYGETTEYVKQVMFKQEVNKELFMSSYINKKMKKVRADWRSTSDLDTKEMTEAIDKFRDYASKEAGIYLPAPDEENFLRHCQEEIERNKYI
jgi:hypothetical protein